MTTGPIEPPGGQDDPPDLGLFLVVVVGLLHDVSRHLRGRRDDPQALADRAEALRAVARRLLERVGEP